MPIGLLHKTIGIRMAALLPFPPFLIFKKLVIEFAGEVTVHFLYCFL